MNSKKWLAAFFGTALALALLIPVLNVLVDPFGVFGDVLFHWDSYSETLNPRVGKLEYLDRHYEEYDSYILGCSSTSSFPVEELNEYMDAKFYNLFVYGADMLDTEDMTRYILRNYTVKNILLNVYIDNGAIYDDPGIDNLTGAMHYAADGSSKLGFYGKYLLLGPRWSLDKVERYFQNRLFADAFDVFDVTSGTYDKRQRDVEYIGDLPEYESRPAYAEFADYPTYTVRLTKTGPAMESLRRIVAMCEDAGVHLTVVCGPVNAGYMEGIPREEAAEFYRALAEVTPFWDFSISSISLEPRYFYDLTHFRNCVGVMAEARMFGDESVYIPEDFGVYVTPENVESLIERNDRLLGTEPDRSDYTCQVPILLYHDVTPDGSVGVSAGQLEDHLRALRDAGYTAVTFDELQAYVYQGAELPEKSVVITFDDGYSSNYQYAFPLLEKYGMKATIFVIGASVGHETYKDTGLAMTPHFGTAEMAEMSDSGVVSIQSHTYDMHQWGPYETGPDIRDGVKRFPGESEAAFVEALQADFAKSRGEIEAVTGKTVDVLAYPGGVYDDLSQWALSECGVRVTLSTRHGVNTLIRGLPQCLFGMYRIYADGYAGGDELVAAIDGLLAQNAE